jgi:hypothetical protein
MWRIQDVDLGDSSTDCLAFDVVELRNSGLCVCIAVDSVLSKPSLILRRLQLLGIPLSVDLRNMKLETIACLFPLLTYLGLSYTLVGRLSYRLDPQMTVEGHLWGSTVLEKVQTLELEGSPKLDSDFLLTMGEGLKRCPNLR